MSSFTFDDLNGSELTLSLVDRAYYADGTFSYGIMVNRGDYNVTFNVPTDTYSMVDFAKWHVKMFLKREPTGQDWKTIYNFASAEV